MEFTIKLTITAGGRLFGVTVHEPFTATDAEWCPVDVRDMRTGTESQAIIEETTAREPRDLIAEPQFRDCVRSVYLNATRNGAPLPDDFRIGCAAAGVAG